MAPHVMRPFVSILCPLVKITAASDSERNLKIGYLLHYGNYVDIPNTCHIIWPIV